jgi:hypothetical protein
MITALSPDGSGAVFTRLSLDLLELILDRVAAAIRGEQRDRGAAALGRLRALVDDCVPARPSGAVQLGALPEILGTVVTLQYPLMQLERFLGGQPSDIGGPAQAELHLSFVRYHLWKLEHLLRESTRD